MSAYFTLTNTYEQLCEFGNTIRPLRVEIFRSLKNKNVFRARIWEQTTYNLYPTWANIFKGEGLQNRMLSCDDLSREITALVADEPDVITGRECESEDVFFEHIQILIARYLETLRENAEAST